MAIEYPVDVVNTRWAILQLSTQQIIARNKVWPRSDGGEIVGQDPDFVYLLQVSTVEPDYDSRLYQLIRTEEADVEANELRWTWDTQKRPNEERIIAAENVEAEQVTLSVKLEREVVETRLILGAILSHVVDQQQFPPKVRQRVRKYIGKATKFWRNRDRLEAIIEQIKAGEDPDLDTGWEDPEPDDIVVPAVVRGH